jgi:hypothetical protein
MIVENQGREADDFSTAVSKLRRYMDQDKVDIERAAIAFEMKPNQAKAWLKFDDTASAEVKAAVNSGRLSVSAGMEIARNAKTVEAQDLALGNLMSAVPTNGKASTQAARRAAKKAVDVETNDGCTDKRTQRKLLQAVQDTVHGGKSEKTLAYWEGVEDTLNLILGDSSETNKRLVDMLDRVRAAMVKS